MNISGRASRESDSRFVEGYVTCLDARAQTVCFALCVVLLKEEDVVEIGKVDCEKLTRQSAMKFNKANVRKPLASAVSVTKAGNRIVLDEQGGFIENKITKERMKVRIEKNTYVYDVQMEDGAMVTVTLDSGAGCNVWPKGVQAGASKLLPRQAGMKM